MKWLVSYVMILTCIHTIAYGQLGMSRDDLVSKWGPPSVVDDPYPYNYLSENCWDRSVGKESDYGYQVLLWGKKDYTIKAIIHPSGKCVGLRIARTDKKNFSKSVAYQMRGQLCPKSKFIIDKVRSKNPENPSKQTGESYSSGWIREFAIANDKYLSTYSYQIDQDGKQLSPATLQIDDLYPDQSPTREDDNNDQITLRYIPASQILPDGILSLSRKHMMMINIPQKKSYTKGDTVIGFFMNDGTYEYISVLGAQETILKIKWMGYPLLPHVMDTRRIISDRKNNY